MPVLRRFMIVGLVRGHGWHQHIERRTFLTHSGAVLFALRVIRQAAHVGDLRVEWHPAPVRSRVRDPITDRWLPVRDLPAWPPQKGG